MLLGRTPPKDTATKADVATPTGGFQPFVASTPQVDTGQDTSMDELWSDSFLDKNLTHTRRENEVGSTETPWRGEGEQHTHASATYTSPLLFTNPSFTQVLTNTSYFTTTVTLSSTQTATTTTSSINHQIASHLIQPSTSKTVPPPMPLSTKALVRSISSPGASKKRPLDQTSVVSPNGDTTKKVKSQPVGTLSSRATHQSQGEQPTAQPVSADAKPPPLVLQHKKYFPALERHLKTLRLKNKPVGKARGVEFHIITSCMYDYNKVKQAMDDQHLNYHTYQPKTTRTKRYVIRNLIRSTDLNILKEELGEAGFQVVSLQNKTKSDGTVFPLVVVELAPSPNIETFKDTKVLMSQMISVEEERPRGPPICGKCQRFNHTKQYCNREPRCGICTLGHQTTECPTPDAAPKCVNCHAEGTNGHRPTYKGCPKYREYTKQPALDNGSDSESCAESSDTEEEVHRERDRAVKPTETNQHQRRKAWTKERTPAGTGQSAHTTPLPSNPPQAVGEAPSSDFAFALSIIKQLVSIFRVFKAQGLMPALEMLAALIEQW